MKRYDLEITATGPVMEERKEGEFVPFSEVSGLADTVMKVGSRCMLLADLLREATKIVPAIGVAIDDMPVVDAFLERIEAALSGKLPEQHPDDAAVDRFAKAMKAKLAAAREKGSGGWDDPEACSVELLAELLVGHIGKVNNGNFEDIANLAMMLHQRGADPAVLASKQQVMASPRGWSISVQETDPRHGHVDISGPGVFLMTMPVSYSMLDFFKALEAAEEADPAIPEGWQLVPLTPTEEQWDGLARAIVFWMRSYPSNQHTPRTLVEFITSYGHAVPKWMEEESELLAKDHVISKGTIAVLIYKAMLTAAPKPFISEADQPEGAA